jgi:hypothetical protein
MGIFNLTESERNEILSLHNNARILKEQATPATPATPAASTPQDRKSKIMKLQTALKTKYNADLGTTGPNKDGIDGDLGAKTLAAISNAMKSKGTAAPASTTGTAAPASTTGTAAPASTTGTAAPASTTGTAVPASTTGTAVPQSPQEVMGTEVPAQQQLSQTSQQALGGQLTPQQIRQQSRFDQKLARQARRTARRAQ